MFFSISIKKFVGKPKKKKKHLQLRNDKNDNLCLYHRLVKSQIRSLINPSKNVLDGDLLSKFKDLSHSERHELARKIGTSPDQVSNCNR